MRGDLSEKDAPPAVPPGGSAGLIVSGAQVVATMSTLRANGDYASHVQRHE